jgi:hypothetical protein
MDCKENVLYFFLQGKISLSQYDHKFISNLQMMIHKNYRVTSNQAALLDKLISKYAKQLAKAGLNNQELKSLPWKSMIVESTPDYTGATVSLQDDIITLRVPFNKNFIAAFRDLSDNPFEWIKEHKLYRAPFSTFALKTVYKTLPRFFSIVSYCDQLSDIINGLKELEAKVWEPTIVRSGDNLILGAVSGVTSDLISHIDMKFNSDSLYNLSKYQFPVYPETFDAHPELKFAYEYVTEIDIDRISLVARWMRKLQVQRVVLDRSLSLDRKLRAEIENMLDGIEVIPVNKYDTREYNKELFPRSFLFQLHSHLNISINSNIDKIVVLKNSRPVEVK